MKFTYEAPVVLLFHTDEEDVIATSGFSFEKEGEGDHIGIDEL